MGIEDESRNTKELDQSVEDNGASSNGKTWAETDQEREAFKQKFFSKNGDDYDSQPTEEQIELARTTGRDPEEVLAEWRSDEEVA